MPMVLWVQMPSSWLNSHLKGNIPTRSKHEPCYWDGGRQYFRKEGRDQASFDTLKLEALSARLLCHKSWLSLHCMPGRALV